ncbi:MAG TPA: fructosamine kinase family protein [Herpetosiphonaceae bacterium]|nr:fructosamine kinase family protein [Herpetosiphonaceae bacterium]
MLPDELRGRLAALLGEPLGQAVAVGGGDISRAARVRAHGADWLVKWRPGAPDDFFAAEADGLERLRAAGSLPVPEVLAHAAEFIVIEWFDDRGRYDPADLGAGLAALHGHGAPRYGYERDNFIGALPQPNAWTDGWPAFWRDQRLLPQIRLADRAGHIRGSRARGLDRLCARLDALLDHRPAPALLHGDLWAGNVIAAPDGRPALIDPAVSYGDRETDLAFAALFGGFGPAFFTAYQAAGPTPPGAAERRPLYQLYWLLVHLTLFGESYGAAVDAVTQRYI